METKADLDEVLLLLLRVVLASLGVDDGCVCVGRVVSSFGFVSEVRAWKESGDRPAVRPRTPPPPGTTKGSLISPSKPGPEGLQAAAG